MTFEQRLLKMLGLDQIDNITKLNIFMEATELPVVTITKIIFDGNLPLLNEETGLLGTSTTKYKLVEVDEDESGSTV